MQSPVAAQVVDTSKVAKPDSLAAKDTLPPKPDTIKAPIAQAEAPVLSEHAGRFHWERRNLFSTGALTVQDLLDQVPGLQGIRVNWLSQPITASYLGDPGRVRVFLDGLELEELDPRMGRVWDLSQVPLWTLDALDIERTAAEVRVHLRSWRVDRTTPYSRTDVYSGDQATNLYRGLFGRRYKHGEILQFAAQQFSTTAGRFAGGTSDQLGIMSRIGIARARWTADVFYFRQNRHRSLNTTLTFDDSVASIESLRSDAYARFAWSQPDSGLWVQALAATSSYEYSAPQQGSTKVPKTPRSRVQYVLTGGYGTGALRASVTQRYFVGLGRHVASPSARVGYETPRVSATIYGEGRGLDSTRRFDASAIVRPTSFSFVAASVGAERRPADSLSSPKAPNFARAEAGLRAGRIWLSGGVLQRDAVELNPLSIARTGTPLVIDSAASGTFAAIRGRVWRGINVDIQATRWADSLAAYRAQYSTRTEAFISTARLQRFPSGNFHFRLSVVHEYRSAVAWPDSSGALRISDYRTVSTFLQFKIVSAEVFWSFRNVLGERYVEVPGYRLSRLTNVYGVRWEFWN